METGLPEEARQAKLKAERELSQLREMMDEKLLNAEKVRGENTII